LTEAVLNSISEVMRYVYPRHRALRRSPRRRGFTLIEAATTTVIIGVGCVAMLELLGAGTVANHAGTEGTVAMNLAGNVREAMTGIPFADAASPTHWGPEAGETDVKLFNDCDDFDGWTSAPGTPINAERDRLGSDYASWQQQVKVESVNRDDLSQVIPHLTLTPDLRPVNRVTVSIIHNGRQVYSESWIACYADKSAPATQPSTP
jgi:Tfp pilus assembly protein PilV